MPKNPDHICVRSRWVNCNKGNAPNQDIGARLAACEAIHGDRHYAFFASRPATEAKHILLAEYAKGRTRAGQKLRLSSVHV